MLNRYLLAPLAALLLLAAAPFAAQAQTGGVGIGTTTPDASAALEVKSTSKGLLPPRLSKTQRDAIASPSAGLTIYNTSSNKLNTWNGTSWEEALSSATYAPGPSTTFTYTGSVQTYTVPAGVSTVYVEALGAQGGTAASSSGTGGLGAQAQAALTVTPGQVLYVYVGGAGNSIYQPTATGYNGGGLGSFDAFFYTGGGGGGGASDVRTSASGAAYTDRLLVAAGGGGGGYFFSPGGSGGAPNGAAGSNNGGAGATQASGNAPGQGGAGGPDQAGGGGGYYGGFAGASASGAGGGSSWATPTGSSGVAFTAGVQAGDGQMTIRSASSVPAPAFDGRNLTNVPGDNLGNHTATTNIGLNGNWLSNATGNANGIRIDGSGNVGIGTASPGHPLTVQANGGSQLLGFNDGNGTDKYNWSLANGGLNLSESNVAGGRLFVQAGGNVGIGTTAPTQKLDVAGNSNISGNTTVGGSVGIGTTSPAASAALDVSSTSKGLLPPRLDKTQRDAIAAPAAGLTVYNTSSNKLNVWNGTSWDESLSTTEQGTPGTTTTFSYTGGPQTYTVPAGVRSLQVTANGAQGGDNSNAGRGGLGGRVETTLVVVPGEVLTVYVGGAGTTADLSGNAVGAGYNGGGGGRYYNGGGGGASDVRRGAAGTTSLADRLVVAGGGGGASNGGGGGDGGGLTGATGQGNYPGQGGSQSAGGTGGAGTGDGSLGQGGTGNFTGGGGGYYGGGGGTVAGSDGGGGSSYATATGSSNTSHTQGSQTGDGSVTLTTAFTYAAPVLDASNFVNLPVAPGDNLGNHTATRNLNLGTNALVGNGGSTGLTIAANGAVTTASDLTATGTTKLSALANGSSTRMVTAAADGTLNAAPLPTDAQQLSKAGSTISLTNGGSVTDADNQTLSISGTTLSLTNGGSVTLPSASGDNLGNHTATQNIGLNGNWLSNATGNANGIRIDGSGNVGIGTASPGAGLHVSTAEKASVSTSGGVFLSGGGAGNPSIELRGTSGAAYLDFVNDLTTDYASRILSTSSGLGLHTGGSATPQLLLSPTGGLTLSSLGGSGTRPVTTTASGALVAGSYPQLGINGQTLSLTNGGSVTLPSASGDNLGNHTATQNIGLNGNWLSNAPGNANGLRVDASGKVGIGTATPGQPLTVQADGGGAALGFKSSTGTDKYNWSLNNGGLNLSESNVASGRLFVQEGGNVGIGTTSPGQKLDVSGNANVSGNTTVSGNVGIGIAIPTQKLDVMGNTNVTGNTSVTGNATVGGNSTVTGNSYVTGSVGIGTTTTPDASAALEVKSTSKGLLPPRLTQAQRDAIASPATGLTLYNTDGNKLNTWNGSSWTESLTTTDQPSQGAAVTFDYTGAEQSYTVPSGVYSLGIEAAGAAGSAAGSSAGSVGGLGGRVQATLAVTPGEVLKVYVGGAGTSSGAGQGGAGYNGGGPGSSYNGGGGGGTDLRRGGSGPTERILVAGGGGGGGGSAGSAGGGAGGGLIGGAGKIPSGGYAASGSGGTQSEGGSGGEGFGPGSFFQGGTGVFAGGGGGYYGGGGGGSNTGARASGSGGGGSSFVTTAGSSAITHTQGYRAGNGQLIITPGLRYATPVLDGTNFINVAGTWSVSGPDVYRPTGQVGVGTGGSPVASAQLEVASTTRGFLPPRLTEIQRDNILSPVAGLTVFNTTSGKLSVWNGTSWSEALTTTEQPPVAPQPRTYGYTGAVQPYTVPAGVTSLIVEASGAQGGSGSVGTAGGLGARIQTTLAVTPGQTLYLYVGGAGSTATSNSGGYNGGGNNGALNGNRGGGGGGASDIRTSASGTAYTDRLLTAAGGGGGGNGAGGNGGTTTGAAGSGTSGGAGGTQTSGNALGQGGSHFPNEYSGGGGGGYWGGRFGATASGLGGGGSGGGGSSFVTPTGTSATTLTAGVQAGNGSITLTLGGPILVAPTFSAANLTALPAANLVGSVPAASLPALASTASGSSRTISLGTGNSTTISVGDDLGNHTATQNLNLGANLLTGNGGSAGLSVSGTGQVGIGTTATTGQKLEVAGNVKISGTGNGLTFPDGTTQTTAAAANLTGDVTSNGTTTTYANVVPATKGGAGLLNGILKGNGNGTVTAAAAADFPTLNQNTTGNANYATTAGTVTTNANLTGAITSTGNATAYNQTVPAAKGGAGSVSGLLKADGSGTVSAAVAGTDYAPATGSAAYIQNTTTQQTANFNISGSGSVGGNVGIGTTAAAPATQKLDVRGNLRLGADGGNNATGLGQTVEFVGPGFNTDPVGLYRTNPATDASELRVVVGDASDANDKFVVGRSNATAEGGLASATFTPSFTVRADGNVGIGTSAPVTGLHIDRPETSSTSALGVLMSGGTTGNPSIELRGTTSSPYLDFVENTGLDYSTRLISQAGTLSVLWANPGTKPANIFNVDGGIRATAFNVASDARFKTNVRPIDSALAAVLALRGVRYDWNALGVQHGGRAGAPQVGLLAQEVERIYPELVATDKDGYKSVNYAQLTPVLIEALKEQQQQIEALKARAASAEAKATQATDEARTAKAQANQATATLETFEARLRRLEAAGGQAQR